MILAQASPHLHLVAAEGPSWEAVSPWAEDCRSSTLGFQAVLRTLEVSGAINSVLGSDRERAQGDWKSSHLAGFSAHSSYQVKGGRAPKSGPPGLPIYMGQNNERSVTEEASHPEGRCPWIGSGRG